MGGRHGAAGGIAEAERREHAHGAVEHGQVLRDLLVEITEAGRAAEGCLELRAETFLLLGEAVEGHFQVGRQQVLHAVAVEADQLAQELDRQQVLAAAFLFENDLGQYRAGDVVTALGIEHDEVDALAHHVAQVVQRDVGRGRGIVEPAVGVLLDDDAFAVTFFRPGPGFIHASTLLFFRP